MASQRRNEYADSGKMQSLYFDSNSLTQDDSENDYLGKMQSLSNQLAFGRYGSDMLRPSMSFDCLGSLYDEHFSSRVSISPKASMWFLC